MANNRDQDDSISLQQRLEEEEIQASSVSSNLSYLNVHRSNKAFSQAQSQNKLMEDSQNYRDTPQNGDWNFIYQQKEVAPQYYEFDYPGKFEDPQNESFLKKIFKVCRIKYSRKGELTEKQQVEINHRLQDFLEVCMYDEYTQQHPEFKKEQPKQVMKKRRKVYHWIRGKQARKILYQKLADLKYQAPPRKKYKNKKKQREEKKEINDKRQDKDFQKKTQLWSWRAKNGYFTDQNPNNEEDLLVYYLMETETEAKNKEMQNAQARRMQRYQYQDQYQQKNVKLNRIVRCKEYRKDIQPISAILADPEKQVELIYPKPQNQFFMQEKEEKALQNESEEMARIHHQIKREETGKQPSHIPKSEGSLSYSQSELGNQ